MAANDEVENQNIMDHAMLNMQHQENTNLMMSPPNSSTRARDTTQNSSPVDPFAGMPTPPPLTPAKTSMRHRMRSAWRQASGTIRNLKERNNSTVSLLTGPATPKKHAKRKSSNPLQALVYHKKSKIKSSNQSSSTTEDDKVPVRRVSEMSLTSVSRLPTIDSGSMRAQFGDVDDSSFWKDRAAEDRTSPITTPLQNRHEKQAKESVNIETAPSFGQLKLKSRFPPYFSDFADDKDLDHHSIVSELDMDIDSSTAGSGDGFPSVQYLPEVDKHMLRDWKKIIRHTLNHNSEKAMEVREIRRLEERLDRELARLRSDVFQELGRIKESGDRGTAARKHTTRE